MSFNALQLSEEEIFDYHLGGKIGIELLKKLSNPKELSIAYTPGVGKVCKAIEKDESKIWDYTSKGNNVAIVTDGTAVLGFGNIGAKASIPVMEGKAALFKFLSGISAWPVPLENVHDRDGHTDVEKLITVVKSIACMFGGINLEDIAAPACFEIEDRLSQELNIPVFHDDQWGSAIIILAAVENYLIISNKKRESLKVVINGAGAAGIRTADLLKEKGIKNITICDSKGVISTAREDLNRYKQKYAIKTQAKTLKEAMQGADLFIGVSVASCVSPDMILSMNSFPAIFALANPVPEISYEEVEKCLAGKEYLMATGRSDYPNQINNALGFPFIFKGALDVKAPKITLQMKLAAAKKLAEIARQKEIPSIVKKIYKGRNFDFGTHYFIPTIFDPRLKDVALAVSNSVKTS